MLFFIIYLVLHNQIPAATSIFIENLETLFNNKHCIEASLVSISLDHRDSLVLDSSDAVKESLNTVNNSVKFDKSVTSVINELAQLNNIEYVYKLKSEDGPPHSKTYEITLILGDETYESSGPSLKKAKEAAAALALQNTNYKRPLDKIKEPEEQSQTPTVILNNIAMKLGISVSYFLLNGEDEKSIDTYGSYEEPYGKSKNLYSKINSTSNPLRVPVEETQISGPFYVKVKIGGWFFKGMGHTIQAARHDAALQALKNLEKQVLFGDNACATDDSAEQCKNKKEGLKSPISRVHEIAQKYGLSADFKIISETGKSHKKVFVTQCILGDFVTEGEGTAKKESKRIAAENMLKYLPHLDLPEKYNENWIVKKFSNKKKKKNKKKKIIKDSVDNFVHSVSQIASLWSENFLGGETPSADNNDQKKSPKDKILELGSKLNIQIEFTDLTQSGGEFYSVMKLGVKPAHLCLGKAGTRENSHEAAALYGLKFLQKSGVFEKNDLKVDVQSDNIGDYDFEETTSFTSFEDLKKKK